MVKRLGEGRTAPYIEPLFRGDFMERMHTQFGHLSYAGMANAIETRGWWPNMARDIRHSISARPNCQVVQRQRAGQEKEYAHLVTDPFIQPFQRWGIDLIGILPKTNNGNRWIITAIDYATGWPVAKAIPRVTEEAIADFIFDEIYMHYGAPQELFSDGGKYLWGAVLQAFLKKMGTKHKGSSPYHPRTNGKVECLNGILESMISKLLFGKPTKHWDLYLDQDSSIVRLSHPDKSDHEDVAILPSIWSAPSFNLGYTSYLSSRRGGSRPKVTIANRSGSTTRRSDSDV